MLEKILESPLDCKETKPVHPKGNQSWIFIGRTDTKAEAPTLWPHDVKNQLTGKDPDAGEDWRWEQKGMTEDEMVGWHHWLNGHELEETQGHSERQGSLVCCSPWGRKESETTWRLKNNITALQYCGSVYWTATWIGYMYTHSPSVVDLAPTTTPSHPSRSAEGWAELPVVYTAAS